MWMMGSNMQGKRQVYREVWDEDSFSTSNLACLRLMITLRPSATYFDYAAVQEGNS
jgi:hypothetical protein